jgi:hypothetical protein
MRKIFAAKLQNKKRELENPPLIKVCAIDNADNLLLC